MDEIGGPRSSGGGDSSETCRISATYFQESRRSGVDERRVGEGLHASREVGAPRFSFRKYVSLKCDIFGRRYLGGVGLRPSGDQSWHGRARLPDGTQRRCKSH